MFGYQVTYRMQMGAFFAEVSEFPEASAHGATLSDARNNLIASLGYAAHHKLRRGEPMPLPAPSPGADVYLVESVVLLPVGDDRVEVRVTAAG
jgi:predicted RNase H-like HicB family nuclease